ncbi:MAG: hypothetical protein WBR18_05540 [Anaerolineales bacterium]
MDDGDREQILNALDSGDISAGEALRRLEADEGPVTDSVQQAAAPRRPPAWRRYGWIVLFDIGLVLAAAGVGLAILGGWWWILAAPLLLVGITIGGLGLGSISSPWIHIQVDSSEDEGLRRFQIGLPLPLRPTAWLLRNFGHYVDRFDQSGLDELLIAMSGQVSADNPVVIDVQEDDNGERVRVYFG